MVAKKFVSAPKIQTGKEMLVKIVSMLFGTNPRKLRSARLRRGGELSDWGKTKR
jgi:hypothetical protein